MEIVVCAQSVNFLGCVYTEIMFFRNSRSQYTGRKFKRDKPELLMVVLHVNFQRMVITIQAHGIVIVS